jgi:hypothetical protein
VVRFGNDDMVGKLGGLCVDEHARFLRVEE